MEKLSNLDDLPDLVPTFEQFSECTEYFYEELGKLDQVPNLTTRDRKRLKKSIMFLLNKHLGLLKTKYNVEREKETASVQETMNQLHSYKKNMSLKNKSLKQLPSSSSQEKKLLPETTNTENEKPGP